MKTTVEELAIALYEGGYLKGNGDEIQELVDKAKEMEKEQTLDFTRNAVRKILDEDRQNPFNLEQYYKETYGGSK
jgi:hypothetical protein